MHRNRLLIGLGLDGLNGLGHLVRKRSDIYAASGALYGIGGSDVPTMGADLYCIRRNL